MREPGRDWENLCLLAGSQARKEVDRAVVVPVLEQGAPRKRDRVLCERNPRRATVVIGADERRGDDPCDGEGMAVDRDGRPDERRIGAQALGLAGVLDEREHAAADRVACRLVAGDRE